MVSPIAGFSVNPISNLPVNSISNLSANPVTGFPVNPGTAFSSNPPAGFPVNPGPGFSFSPVAGFPTNPLPTFSPLAGFNPAIAGGSPFSPQRPVLPAQMPPRPPGGQPPKAAMSQLMTQFLQTMLPLLQQMVQQQSGTQTATSPTATGTQTPAAPATDGTTRSDAANPATSVTYPAGTGNNTANNIDPATGLPYPATGGAGNDTSNTTPYPVTNPDGTVTYPPGTTPPYPYDQPQQQQQAAPAVEQPKEEQKPGLMNMLQNLQQMAPKNDNKKKKDPLTLDLNGDGISTTAPNRKFDLDGNGTQETISSLGIDDATLVFDANGNGIVGENGKEVFGDSTDIDGDGKADGFANGFEALKGFASRKLGTQAITDSKLDADELAQLDQAGLRLQVGGQLKRLSEAGVDSIGLNFQHSNQVDAFGNEFREQGTFTRNGQELTATDIWFNT